MLQSVDSKKATGLFLNTGGTGGNVESMSLKLKGTNFVTSPDGDTYNPPLVKGYIYEPSLPPGTDLHHSPRKGIYE